jgi:periplasmic divalent cation tolerance protein
MERVVLVYAVYPSVAEAERAGRAMVERRLAAGVNIFPGMVSHFWWEGIIARSEEVAMILKTRESLSEALTTAIREMHSYSTPAIVTVPIQHADAGYQAWIVEETTVA